MKQPISKEQLRDLLQDPASEIQVIDIRSRDEFEKKHIPVSENVPVEELAERSATWNKESIVVCVCNRGHERSQNAAAQLSESGFESVFFLEGGVMGWFEESS